MKTIPEIIDDYTERFLKKRKLSDGSSAEYIYLKGTALDKDFQDFLTTTLTRYRKELIAEMMPEDKEYKIGLHELPWAQDCGWNACRAEMKSRAEKITTPTI